MTQAAIGTDFHEPLDVEGNILAEISFHFVLLLDQLSYLVNLVIIQFTNFRVETDCRFAKNPRRLRAADPVDVSQRDFHTLVRWKIHTCDTCHPEPPATLDAVCVSC